VCRIYEMTHVCRTRFLFWNVGLSLISFFNTDVASNTMIGDLGVDGRIILRWIRNKILDVNRLELSRDRTSRSPG
jgi:hypothetical protein